MQVCIMINTIIESIIIQTYIMGFFFSLGEARSLGNKASCLLNLASERPMKTILVKGCREGYDI